MTTVAGTPTGRRPALDLTHEEMRTIGYRTIDTILEHFATLDSKSVTRTASRDDLHALLTEPIPEQPGSIDEIFAQLDRDVFGRMMHVDHPRFFSFVPAPSNFIGAMADALSAAHNVFALMWLVAAGPSAVETVAIDWLRQLVGLPEPAGGLFTSGGSMANLTAMALAISRQPDPRREGKVAYCSDQTHISIDRALRHLGFAPDQLRRLPSTAAYTMDHHVLREAIRQDRAAGRQPYCVIGTAGTTNTGAVDPLDPLADICANEGLWLHVDAAFGGAVTLSRTHAGQMTGLGRAQSITLDPQKWLFAPIDCGALLVRDRAWLREAFRILPEYLEDGSPRGDEVNFCDQGLELARPFRALKLWMSLKFFGVEAFRDAVDRGLALAEDVQQHLDANPAWEVVTPAQLGIVTFRFSPPGSDPARTNQITKAVVGDMIDDGFALVTSTRLRGINVLRLCLINPRTSMDDVVETLTRLERMARRRLEMPA